MIKRSDFMAWLGPLLVLPGLALLVFLPVLLFPHWGLWSDADQILVASPKFWAGDWALKVSYLAGQLQRPIYHLMNYTLYKVFGDQPVYFYLNQWVLLTALVLLTYLNCLKLSRSVLASLVFASLWLITSSLGEVIYTLDKAELVSTVFMTASLSLYLWGDRLLGFPSKADDSPGRMITPGVIGRWLGLALLFILCNGLAFFAKQTPHILILSCLSLPVLAYWFWKCWPQRAFLDGWCKRSQIGLGLLYLSSLILVFALFKLFDRWSGGSEAYLSVHFDLLKSIAALYNYYRYLPDINTLVLFCLFSTIYWVVRRKLVGDPDQLLRALQATNLTLLGFATFLILASWRSEVTYIWFPVPAFLLPAACYYAMLLLSRGWPWSTRRLHWLIGAGLVALLIVIPTRALEMQGVFNIDALKDQVAQALVQYRLQQTDRPMTIALAFQGVDATEIGERLEYFSSRVWAAQRPDAQKLPMDSFRFFNFLDYTPPNPNYPQPPEYVPPPQPANIIPDPRTTLGPVGLRMFAYQDSALWSTTPKDWTESRLTPGTYLLVPYGDLPRGRFYFRGAGLFTESLQDRFRFMPQVELADLLTIERPLQGVFGRVGTMAWKLLRVKNVPPISWNLSSNGWLPYQAEIFYDKTLVNSTLTLQGVTSLDPGAPVKVYCDGGVPRSLSWVPRSPPLTELTIPLSCPTPTTAANVFIVHVESSRPMKAQVNQPNLKEGLLQLQRVTIQSANS